MSLQQDKNEHYHGTSLEANLDSSLDYRCTARVKNEAGLSTKQEIIIKGTSNTNLLIISGVLTLCILVTLSILGALKWRMKIAAKNPSSNGKEITLYKFPKVYKSMRANDCSKMKEEFTNIEDFSNYVISTKETHKKALANRACNRYVNILPFDRNAVPIEDDGVYSYINASYISGYRQKQEYIAAQGPLPDTCYDFWRMTVQNKVDVIVMLTQLVESGKVKCAQYYPDANSTLEFENMKVTHVAEAKKRAFVKKTFLVEWVSEQ
jgi:hypothetical protein